MVGDDIVDDIEEAKYCGLTHEILVNFLRSFNLQSRL